MCALWCCLNCSLSKQNKYSQEELALMKSQDVKYLSMKEKTEKQVRVCVYVLYSVPVCARACLCVRMYSKVVCIKHHRLAHLFAVA